MTRLEKILLAFLAVSFSWLVAVTFMITATYWTLVLK